MSTELLARTVLNDCRWAVAHYPHMLSGEPLRISWVAITSLLRAVGHVLRNNDAVENPHLSEAISKQWKELQDTKPGPEIFWEFIESERNSVLKQYSYGFRRTYAASKPPLGVAGLEIRVDLGSVRGGPLPTQPLPNLESLILDGPFRGRNEKEVALEAIAWWEEYLQRIERSVK